MQATYLKLKPLMLFFFFFFRLQGDSLTARPEEEPHVPEQAVPEIPCKYLQSSLKFMGPGDNIFLMGYKATQKANPVQKENILGFCTLYTLRFKSLK